jgi:hypothetical protein
MSPWGWVLTGLAAIWLAPALVVVLMLGWGILRSPRAHLTPGLQASEKPTSTGQPLQEAQLSREGKRPPGGDAA